MLSSVQKRKVEQLRQEGMGYKRIVAELNISRDVVRNYCRSHGLGGYGKNYAPDSEIQIDDNHCMTCNKKLVQSKTGRKRKFCSEECRREYWNVLHHTTYSHVCQYCGKEFESYVTNSKYCCHNCYIHDRFWRKEDLEAFLEDMEKGNIPEMIPRWIQETKIQEYFKKK